MSLPHIPLGTLSLAGLLVTFCYALTCAISPFGTCRRCHGLGRQRRRIGRSWRYCRHCDGTGRRIRLGRHAYNLVHRTYRNSH